MNTFIKEKIRGAVELTLFMRESERFFRGSTLRTAAASFLIPFLFLPYGIWGLSLTHNTELQTLSDLEGINNFSFETFLGLTTVKVIMLTLIKLTILFYFTKWMERSEYFYDCIAAGNWLGIPAFVLGLPITLMIAFGGSEWMSVYILICMYILYGVAVGAFMLTRVLNIPWELATGYAIFGLALSEFGNKIVNLIGIQYFS